MYVNASALFIGSLVAHAPGVVVVLQYPWQIDLLKVVRLLHVISRIICSSSHFLSWSTCFWELIAPTSTTSFSNDPAGEPMKSEGRPLLVNSATYSSTYIQGYLQG